MIHDLEFIKHISIYVVPLSKEHYFGLKFFFYFFFCFTKLLCNPLFCFINFKYDIFVLPLICRVFFEMKFKKDPASADMVNR